METWEGKRLGQSGAVDEYEASKAYSFQDYENILPTLLRGFNDIYCDYSSNNFEKYDKKILTHAVPYDQRGADFSNATLYSLQPLVSELRLIKSDGEIELLTKACDTVSYTHLRAHET